MNRYFLIGIPGCGKSTLGQRVAEMLTMPFYDTDKMAYSKMKLESRFAMMLPSNQARFMAEQRKAILEIADLDPPMIVATGAEVALIPECAECMGYMGKTIHIRREVDIILNDIKNGSGSKLVLREVNTGYEIPMAEKAVELYSKELSRYEMLADFMLDNNAGPDEGLENLFALITDVENGCCSAPIGPST